MNENDERVTYDDIIFYDIEVFPYYWCIVFNEYNSEEYVVIDKLDILHKFYTKYKDRIFVGYNSRGYDLPVFKAILGSLNPYIVSSGIIEGRKISSLIPRNIQSMYSINNYDAYDGQHSLKQLEAFMGMDIQETEVDFNLNRRLTQEEIDKTHFYCKHDVYALKEYFKIREKILGSFESHAILISEYKLPKEYFNKTGVQLTSIILGAVQQHTISDEFNFTIPKTLNLSEDNKDVLEFYKKPENKCYRKIFASDKNSSGNWKKEFTKKIAGIDCVYGFGGFHGSIDNLILENAKILVCDVASEYPNYMINYDSISRKVQEPLKFNSVVQKRLELKAKKDSKNKAFKPVINGTFGATKDRNNPMYDPRIANQITVGCQLLMTDLLEKVGDYVKPINNNTDGLYMVVENDEIKDKVINICHEWEQRTGFELEFDMYDKIIQANVNNYIMAKKNEDGSVKYKAKGGFFKQKTPIDNDLPIVTEALINYFVYNIPIEETINNCNELIKFQKVIKLTEKYNKVVLGKTKNIEKKNGLAQVIDSGVELKEKVHRVFASKDTSDDAIWKIKKDNGIEVAEKLAYTSSHVFIDNGNVINKECPEKLDRQYYIDLVKDRLNQILEPIEEKVNELPNFLYECWANANNYIDFLKNINVKYKPTIKAIRKYIIANTCEDFGKTKKLNDFIDYFGYFYGKKSLTLNNITKKFGDNQEIMNIIQKNSEPNVSGKGLIPNIDKILNDIFEYLPNEDLPLKDILLTQADLFEELRYTNENLDNDLWIVQNYSINIKPTVIIYNLKNGEIRYCFVNESKYKLFPIVDGDIIKVLQFSKKYGKKMSHKDEKGINILVDDENQINTYIDKYKVVERLINNDFEN